MTTTSTNDMPAQPAILPVDVPSSVATSAAQTWLQAPTGAPLARTDQAAREWMFPGTDELFRGIYTRAGTGFTSEVLAVFSAIAGEGRTTVAVGLAVAVAQDFPERRVLLVETEINRPVLAEDFAVEPTPGLVECLIDGEPIHHACRQSFLDNLHIMPAGLVANAPGRPLRSSRMAAVLDRLRQNYDFIVLDLPPFLANSDAVLLTDLADGAICVVRAGVTPLALLNRAVEQVEEGKLRGVVLNGTGSALPGWLRRLVGM